MAAGDPEMAEFAREEIASLSQQIERETQLLKVLLLPKDPLDEKNIMLEARTTVPLISMRVCLTLNAPASRYAAEGQSL